MIIKFGKYRGYDITEVPIEYLEWMLEANRRTISEIEEELERRKLAEMAKMSWLERVIATGYKELAKKHHPDVGGDAHEMQQINAAVELLREMITVHDETIRKAS